MPEWWTNRSRLPSSGVMKPNPLSSLNHLTVPVAIWPVLRFLSPAGKSRRFGLAGETVAGVKGLVSMTRHLRRGDLALQNLSGRTFWQLVDEPHRTGVLVGGQPLLDVVAQFVRAGVDPRLQ